MEASHIKGLEMFTEKDIQTGIRRCSPDHPLQRPIDWEAVSVIRAHGSRALANIRVKDYLPVDSFIEQANSGKLVVENDCN